MFFVFIYAYCCWCHLAVTRRITIVEQELHTLLELLGFAFFFICLSGVPCCWMLSNFMFSFQCCDFRYKFRVTRCSVRLYYYLFYGRFTFYLCFLYLLTYTGVQHDFPVIWCWCHLTVTRRVTIVERELLTLPENLRSSWVFVGFVLLDR